jgi:hypothetical protein
MTLEFLLQLGAMGRFHDEDQIGPLDQLARHPIFGVVVEARRCGFNIRIAREHLLGGRRPQLVLRANEQDVFHHLTS